MKRRMLEEKTIIFAPLKDSIGVYHEVLHSYNLDIDIVSLSDEFTNTTNNMYMKQRITEFVNQGKEILIARGTVAQQIRAYGYQPIELEVTGYDVLQVLKKYIGSKKKIAVVECEAFTNKVTRIAQLLDLDISSFTTTDIDSVREKTITALDEGFQVIVGGSWGEYHKEELADYSAVYEVVGCSYEAVLDTINRAFDMFSRIEEERKRRETMSNILDCAIGGMVSVNQDGYINFCNIAALCQLGMERDKIMGKSVAVALPQLNLSETLRTKRREMNKVINTEKGRFVVSNVPIMVDNKLIGAVSTFESLKDVEEGDAKIRRQMIQKGLSAAHRFQDIIGKNEQLKEVIQTAKSYAGIDSTVLITGESGTGKELFAQAIHNASNRSNQPFVAINCAALTESLLESELFGYSDGAFTGAIKGGKAGIFELAHKGTIFLDEIGEINKRVQSQLLRVLQEKEVRRIGDDKVIPVDVRVIAATNVNLYDYVLDDKFRKDLYFRLAVLNIHIPPLRDRKDDIPLLVTDILRHINLRLGSNILSLEDKIMDELMHYDWPGNVRELQNTLEKMAAITWSGKVCYNRVGIVLDEMRQRSLCQEIRNTQDNSIQDVEKRTILEALYAENGNRTKAAKRLGIDRTTLIRKISKYDLDI